MCGSRSCKSAGTRRTPPPRCQLARDLRLMRVWRIPYSTNVERVAIAAGVSGVPIEWIDVSAYDRSPVKEVSGQGRVPVADFDGEIVVGSLAIIGRIAPGLWPSEPRPC